jgi:hypothetical protein
MFSEVIVGVDKRSAGGGEIALTKNLRPRDGKTERATAAVAAR